jgi:hypothetical protein
MRNGSHIQTNRFFLYFVNGSIQQSLRPLLPILWGDVGAFWGGTFSVKGNSPEASVLLQYWLPRSRVQPEGAVQLVAPAEGGAPLTRIVSPPFGSRTIPHFPRWVNAPGSQILGSVLWLRTK